MGPKSCKQSHFRIYSTSYREGWVSLQNRKGLLSCDDEPKTEFQMGTGGQPAEKRAIQRNTAQKRPATIHPKYPLLSSKWTFPPRVNTEVFVPKTTSQLRRGRLIQRRPDKQLCELLIFWSSCYVDSFSKCVLCKFSCSSSAFAPSARLFSTS